ncbi:hypothetical protein I6F35_04145 [Bradyrhizobium sp. BRP22]|uniref:hypothetical protein n=1 Tax=Bradyrhizobium sp. BRP22 TaxID=2793821 RepID=UPI001CD3D1EE|nr:hypothetical protein [Bradyrhizobium sp. BRP22]MCA1452409.1 hypothetical protein [Bradyrhizobium sp. BRP22]
MRRLAIVSAALVAAATLANPVAARERYVQQPAVDPDVTISAAPYSAAPYYPSGPAYYPGPRVGAFATAPWDNSPPPAYYGSPYAAPYYGY